jgi:hypothetical protein
MISDQNFTKAISYIIWEQDLYHDCLKPKIHIRGCLSHHVIHSQRILALSQQPQ